MDDQIEIPQVLAVKHQHKRPSTNRDDVPVLALTDGVFFSWVLNQDHNLGLALVCFHAVTGSMESAMQLVER
jgi:hypothetical protein